MFKKLTKSVDKLTAILQKANIEDMAYLLGNKRRMFWINLWAGIARGIGIGIGFTIITAIVIIILQKIILWNIPVIGDYIYDIIEVIKKKGV